MAFDGTSQQHDHRQRLLHCRAGLRQPLRRQWLGRQPQHAEDWGRGSVASARPCRLMQACTSSVCSRTAIRRATPRQPAKPTQTTLDQSGPNVEAGSVTTNTNNMWSGAGAPNINGSATFVGGTNPITWAGFELTSGSTGHAAGSDGLDLGIRASAGGPPTGGGSAPTNTVAPAVTGSAVNGQTLTTTNGTWTITGNVPTVTTYMWYDCPSGHVLAGSCTPIQPHDRADEREQPNVHAPSLRCRQLRVLRGYGNERERSGQRHLECHQDRSPREASRLAGTPTVPLVSRYPIRSGGAG